MKLKGTKSDLVKRWRDIAREQYLLAASFPKTKSGKLCRNAVEAETIGTVFERCANELAMLCEEGVGK